MKAMAGCQSDKQGNYISWDAGWELKNGTSYDQPLSKFCEKSTDPIIFGFPQLVDFQAYYICQALGTSLPTPLNKQGVNNLHELVDDNWSEESYCRNNFWTPLIDKETEGTWARHYDNVEVDNIPWNIGEPNGIWYENCGFLDKSGIYDGDCKNSIQCAVCEFTSLPVFHMVGNCERELRNINYVVYQPALGTLLFRGYSDYVIDFLDGRWVWYNRRNNQTMAKMIETKITVPHFPMGRRDWELESPVCGQQEGVRTLLLTHCEENEFTCDDGTCIALSDRCDQKYDCFDHSDENNCDIVVFPKSYKKSLTPRSQDKNEQGLPVTLDIIIKSIDIDTMKTTMTLAFELRQTWFDNRLQYINLKPNFSLNRVSFALMPKLWSPEVAFVNTPDNRNTVVDIESAMTVRRLSEASGRDDSAPAEGEIFSLSLYYSCKLFRKFSI